MRLALGSNPSTPAKNVDSTFWKRHYVERGLLGNWCKFRVVRATKKPGGDRRVQDAKSEFVIF